MNPKRGTGVGHLEEDHTHYLHEIWRMLHASFWKERDRCHHVHRHKPHAPPTIPRHPSVCERTSLKHPSGRCGRRNQLSKN
jgi:hypothetical protein